MAALSIHLCTSMTIEPMTPIDYGNGRKSHGCTLVIRTRYNGDVRIDLFAGNPIDNGYDIELDLNGVKRSTNQSVEVF